jgi:GNAT superfamily N-acetyltransferase
VNINKFAKYPELYFTYFDNNILCGIMKVICLNDYLNYPNYMRTCMYISVHDLYQHQGIAKRLIDEYFTFCKNNYINDILYLSPYTNDGKQYLKHIFNNKYKQLVKENINIIG